MLRRILRRAIRHARLLGINEMFLTGAVDVVIGMFGHAYPNLVEKADFIKKGCGNGRNQLPAHSEAGAASC